MVRGVAFVARVAHSLLYDRLHGAVLVGSSVASAAAVRRAIRELRLQQGGVCGEPASGGLLFLHPQPRVRDGLSASGVSVERGREA